MLPRREIDQRSEEIEDDSLVAHGIEYTRARTA
jgi:hypothetical protein